jgi:hypothetical protein
MALEEIELKKISSITNEVYVWSETLKEYEIDFLVNYLVLNKVTMVVVSTGGDKNILNSFIVAVSKEGIAVDLMIGDNKLIDNFSINNLQSKIDGIETTHVSGLHLDVEPHTFDDWKDNKEMYMKKYIKMMQSVKSYTDNENLELAVSIPTHYPEENIQQIFEISDHVYFMCYENVKTDFIARKIGMYDMTTTVIALRTEDLNDRIAIQAKFKDLDNNINPQTFIIHDLGRLIKMIE